MADQSGAVLLVDDDAAVRTVLAALLRQDGLEPLQAGSAEEARELLAKMPVDVVVSDVRMPGMDGLQFLQWMTQQNPDVPVILLTAHGSVPMAVEAMRAGAFDFATKPFDREELLFTVRKALAVARHEGAPSHAQSAGKSETPLLGKSAAMASVLELIRRAASGGATVLIRGESGTGKELAARALHQLSPRRAGPFVKVHCAALPDNLLESELFGYEKGAFTGAVQRKPGRVELAEKGTLFLDEIGDITPATQVKLLRVVQDRQYERLGGTQTLTADVRFVAATHRNLEEMVKAGTFREDLFYRLNVVPVWMPPLRDRPEDVRLLAESFCAMAGPANGKPGARLDAAALALLEAQSWPGNVRQLQNFVERLVVLSDSAQLGEADVRRELGRGIAPGIPGPAPASAAESPGALSARRQDAERQALEDALKRAGNNRTVAARILGVSRRTLYNKLRELGVT